MNAKTAPKEATSLGYSVNRYMDGGRHHCIITIAGESKTLTEWSHSSGLSRTCLSRTCLSSRIRSKCTADDLFAPLKRVPRKPKGGLNAIRGDLSTKAWEKKKAELIQQNAATISSLISRVFDPIVRRRAS